MEEKQTEVKTVPRSYRITEDQADAIKNIATIRNISQTDTIQLLLDAYSAQDKKNSIASARNDDLVGFEKLLAAVQSRYIDALTEAEAAESIARENSEKLTRDMEKKLLNMQDRLAEMQDTVRQQEQQLNGITGLREDVKAKREECEKLTKENEALKESIRELEEEVHNLKTAEIDQKNSLSTVRAAYSELQLDTRNDKETISYLQTENRNLTNKCDMLQKADDTSRQQLTQQIEKELRAKLAAEYAEKEKEYVLKMEETVNTYRQQADSYKDKYIGLLEKQNK